jgi:poly(A) polymerase
MKIIKKFLELISGKGPASRDEGTSLEPTVVPRGDHTVSRRKIDADALKVLNRLSRFHHTAYLVGGGVRDLLLDRKAKDFDIATSAHPNEVKKLFRNCRLIGRRFRLAHILFRGGKVIEVSTFRCHAGFSDEGDLLIKSDNTFGTAEEDALRRDFTVNGLFYNIADFTVIDYVGGLKDIESKIISTIGDPDIRFREDPIRMLRALRFAARLDFSLAENTARALQKHRREIWKAAVPRILEEILRMLQQGAAAESFRLMDKYGTLKIILPRLGADYADAVTGEQIRKNLSAIDGMAIPKDRLAPAFLIAVLYFPSFLARIRKEEGSVDRLRQAAQVLEEDLAKLHFPRSHLARTVYFDDALSLFELTRPRSKENRAIVGRWRSLGQQVQSESPGKPATGEKEGDAAKKPSRSRSRRRRGPRRKPASGDSATKSDSQS